MDFAWILDCIVQMKSLLDMARSKNDKHSDSNEDRGGSDQRASS
jgi:hypothetical protein